MLDDGWYIYIYWIVGLVMYFLYIRLNVCVWVFIVVASVESGETFSCVSHV